VAELLRRYHDAVVSFDATGYAWPESVPVRFRGGIISHNDPNLDNVIFGGGRAVALIDFDLASPGSAVWDVACAARLWAPLRDETDVPEQVRGRTLARLRTFVECGAKAVSDAPTGRGGGSPRTARRCGRSWWKDETRGGWNGRARVR
jgi:hypothetical protein